MRIRAAYGAMTVRSRENFQFKIGQQNTHEDGEAMCETRLSFFSQKAQLLKKSFLFYAKNTNQKNKGTN